MIGGEHFLQTPPAVDDSLGELLSTTLGQVSLFSTGRDGLACLLAALPAQAIHLPDLMCASVHEACLAAGKERLIYRVGTDFLHEPSFDPFGDPSQIVFVMHYFGICNDTLMRQAKSAGLTVVSDVTHLLFDREGMKNTAAHSDFLIASLRKSGPFPDGGFVSSLAHRPVEPTLGIREEFFALRAAGLLSRGFSATADFADDENFILLKRAEELLDASGAAGHRCSYLTQRLLHTVSVADAAAGIHRNAAVLAAGLADVCIVPAPGDRISPYFPCIFRDREQRDAVRSRLASRKCHFPVHWPAAGLPSPSPLADRCLSIPCDARYGESDMHTVLETIRSCLTQ